MLCEGLSIRELFHYLGADSGSETGADLWNEEAVSGLYEGMFICELLHYVGPDSGSETEALTCGQNRSCF